MKNKSRMNGMNPFRSYVNECKLCTRRVDTIKPEIPDRCRERGILFSFELKALLCITLLLYFGRKR